MKKKKTKKIKIFLLIILLFGVAGYLLWMQKEDLPVSKKIKEKSLKIVDINSKSRPYAVMINNHKQARMHHAGLQDAYIVYEIIVEGGLTRMMALFKDQKTERIGSVRISRHYFLDYAMENDAIYVHYGWSPQAEQDVERYGIHNINGLYDADAFWRDRTLRVSSEHTAFTNIEKINAVVREKGYRTKTNTDLLLNYEPDEIELNEKESNVIANNVVIPYSSYITTSYTYDPNTKLYKRFVNGEEHVDSVTKLQYTTKNIIIQKMDNYSIDNYGRQDIDNVGVGEGYYITNGYAIPITWYKDSRDGQTVYKDENDKEIKINDGNTYIQIQPLKQETTIN